MKLANVKLPYQVTHAFYNYRACRREQIQRTGYAAQSLNTTLFV